MTCSCTGNIPRAEAGALISANNLVLTQFHTRCPDHGVVELGVREMAPIIRRAWVGSLQAMAFVRKDNVKVIQKAPDGKSALLEWTDYELAPLPEEEIVTHG